MKPTPSPPTQLHDWRGHLRPHIREADEWYRARLIEAGLLGPEAWGYAGALPDEECRGEP